MLRWIFEVIVSVEDSGFNENRDTLILIGSANVAFRVIADHINVAKRISWIAAESAEMAFRVIVREFRRLSIDLNV